MKKILSIFLTILAAILVFCAIVFLFSQNKGKGALQTTSTPNSIVYLDGKEIGVTPLCKCDLKNMILEGEHVIKLVPKEGGYDFFEQKILISQRTLTVVDRSFAATGFDSASVISLTPIKNSKDTQIFVQSFPSGTQVYLDNNLKGQSPLLLSNVSESDHELKVIKKGYKEKAVRIKTIKGFKLDTIIYLSLDPDNSSTSLNITVPLIASKSATISKTKVIILDTPTGFLRVRMDATVLSSEVSQVKPGEAYEFLSEKDGWFEIKLADGKTGWVSMQYAKKST